MKSRMFWGIVLILAGVLWLVKPHIELGGGAFLAGVGFLFVLLWALTSRYGLLVPGGILLGLGSGLWAGRLMPGPSGRVLFFVCFGAGFILIYLLDRLKRRQSPLWPLIPGGILAGIGAYIAAEQRGWIPAEAILYLKYLWPVLLIVLGLYLLVKKK
jgi:hypothetical protein